MSDTTGYVHCAHTSCFAVIIGKPGDLCEDCEECNPDRDAHDCEGCDNDRGEYTNEHKGSVGRDDRKT
jgi:hypothetical protein